MEKACPEQNDVETQNPMSDIEMILKQIRKSIGNEKGNDAESKRQIQERVTAFGFKITKPAVLVDLNSREKYFYTSQSAQEVLSSLDKKCYVISVSGSPLVGKSTMLNLLVSTMLSWNEQSGELKRAGNGGIPYYNIYQIGDGKKSTTQGIDCFVLNLHDKNVIFLDVEGDNDPHRQSAGAWIYTNLIMTAVALSHSHIYNYNLLIQQNFLDFFRSIDKLIRENDLHESFKTSLHFAKKNYQYNNHDEYEEDKQEMLEYISEFLEDFDAMDTTDPLYVFSSPEDEISNQNNQKSCQQVGYISKDLIKQPFMQTMIGLVGSLINSFNQKDCYENGIEVIEALNKILEINKKDLPYTADEGYLAKIRLEKLRNNQERIQRQLLEIVHSPSNNELLQFIERIATEHPNSADAEFLNKFDSVLQTLTSKSKQMDFMMPELSNFVEDLMDPSSTILNEDEKEVLAKTFMDPFEMMTEYMLQNLNEYLILYEKLIGNLKMIKMQLQMNLKDFVTASQEVKKNAQGFIPVISAGVAGLGVRQVGMTIFANFVLGGGVIFGAMTVYSLVKTKSKIDEIKKQNKSIMEANKVEGIENEEEAKNAITSIEIMFHDIIQDLEVKLKLLTEVAETEGKRNYWLIERIKAAIDKKIKGEKLSIDDNVKLIQGMKVASNNAARFKECI